MDARVASPADLPPVLAMMAAFNAHERIPFDAAVFSPRLAHLIGHPELGGALIFEEASAAVGYAIVTFGFDLEYGGRDAFLTELWIQPEHRQRGLGRVGLAEAERFATAGGAHALHLLVRFDNDAARALYERSGYEAEPRTVMTRRLR